LQVPQQSLPPLGIEIVLAPALYCFLSFPCSLLIRWLVSKG
jgi:hypothetical protein